MGKDKLDSDDIDDGSSWNIVDVLTERLDLNWQPVANTVELLANDNTVPFIARYRKEQTGNMDVDTIREVKANYEELLTVQSKATTVIKSIDKLGKMTKPLKKAIKAAQDLKEIEYLYAPYKAGSKRSLAERARELGLEPLTLKVLSGDNSVDIKSAVKTGKEGLSTLAEVEKGIQHIIADIISKEKDTLDRIRDLCKHSHVTIETTKSRATTKKEKEVENGQALSVDDKQHKFELYFSFTIPIKFIKPHQVLAINRGENLKILSVKVNIPDRVKSCFHQFCESKWRSVSKSRYSQLFATSVEDAYSRLLVPLMTRHFRGDLTKQAEKASVEVFSANLKRLLLTPPVRGEIVLGVDPGFRNGCKFAVADITGKVLDTGVLYLHDRSAKAAHELRKLKELIRSFRCETVAIGNGTACRQTEAIFSDLISSNALKPLDVKYCIVSESGASIYSASDVAQQEFPDMDVTLRGGVSIARRLQDPLAELVKIEPKHIGVGMYQHDIQESQLKTALDGVVEECVSFVGVDINVGSEMLLRRVAGLNAARVKKIIEWREVNGPFSSRAQLRDVKGLGPKSYEQCAGFIRVLSETSSNRHTSPDDAATESEPSAGKGRKRKAVGSGKSSAAKRSKKAVSSEPNSLDMTCVHPESYHIADRLIEMAEAEKENVGQSSFINKIESFTKRKGLQCLAESLGAGEPTVQLIIDGLLQPLGHDMREEFEKPLFKQGLTSIEDLKVGTNLSGRVSNMTHFGAFVDIGVGKDALLHNSKIARHLLRGKATLELGDRVEVAVDSIDKQRGRIGLKLIKLF